MNKKYIVVGLVVALVVSACTPRGEQVMIQNAKGAGYSRGYGDGCESGRKDAGVETAIAKQELSMYLSNPNYKNGWDAGYKECKFREERVAELN